MRSLRIHSWVARYLRYVSWVNAAKEHEHNSKVSFVLYFLLALIHFTKEVLLTESGLLIQL